MPLYEYTCEPCGRRFSWLVGVVAEPVPPTCPGCGATRARKLAVSRFASIRTPQQAFDALTGTQLDSPGTSDDLSAMQQWSKQMGAFAGDSNGLGEDFDEYIDAASAARRAGAQELDNQ